MRRAVVGEALITRPLNFNGAGGNGENFYGFAVRNSVYRGGCYKHGVGACIGGQLFCPLDAVKKLFVGQSFVCVSGGSHVFGSTCRCVFRRAENARLRACFVIRLYFILYVLLAYGFGGQIPTAVGRSF